MLNNDWPFKNRRLNRDTALEWANAVSPKLEIDTIRS